MTHHIRDLVLTIMLLFSAMQAAAQSDFAIGELFDGRFRNNPNAVETVISGDILKDTGLTLFRSIQIKNATEADANIFSSLVKRDSAKALSREEKSVGNVLQGAFYELPPKGATRRYLIYINRKQKGKDKIMLGYLEGKVSPEEVKDMI